MTAAVVSYTGGEERWADIGHWDILHGGTLVLYHVETKQSLVAYGPHHWTRVRWLRNPDDYLTESDGSRGDDSG